MPFTPAHAVVALPFLRTPLIPAAIAIGAMAPDLPLFLGGAGLRYSFTHDPVNVFWTALLAFALFLLWRVVLRAGLRELSPDRLRQRLPHEWASRPGAALREALGVGQSRLFLLMLALSLVLGVLTHIVWDAFTHEGRWGLDLIPALAEPWGPLPGYKWLQHGSTAFGLIALSVFGVLWLRRRDAADDLRRLLPTWLRRGWWLSLPVLLMAAALWGYAVFGPFTAVFTPQHLAYQVLPPACAIWGALGLVLSLAVLLRRRYDETGR